MDEPVGTIGRAGQLAMPGDTVVVHEGTYREWVKPPRGGLSNNRRIVYTAAAGEQVSIKGSEVASSWESVAGGVWKSVIHNSVFGDFNPYKAVIEGDWLVRPTGDEPALHLGEVYLNGTSLHEVASFSEVLQPRPAGDLLDDWTQVPQLTSGTHQTLVWFAEVGCDETTIFANFGDADPGENLVEFNVRRSVFYPVKNHLDHITVRGFEMAHAATPWAPPTADQPGLIGPNWAKGWIIEDNIIHDSKCAGVSLGKEIRTGHNFATIRRDKPGYQYQLESVFAAEDLGWSIERVGSHIVRGNTIYDCGQNAVVGHPGCAFSEITGNHIHNIGVRRLFYGHEIAGIKLHAPIDTAISDNHIHDCSLGLWLDWQTQGTRDSRNILHSNSRDLFVEVSHGPYVVDHNILASSVSLEDFSQGGAYVANLFLGSIRLETVLDRATPYHPPHSTAVAGYAVILGGDDRFIGNVFTDGHGGEPYWGDLPPGAAVGYGTAVYEHFPASFADYMRIVNSRQGDHRRFAGIKQAVTIRDNAYIGDAVPFAAEGGCTVVSEGSISVRFENGHVTVESDLPDAFGAAGVGVIRGSDLGRVRLVDADFENPAGGDLVLDADIVGHRKTEGELYAAGPFASLPCGKHSTAVWRGSTSQESTAGVGWQSTQH